jgi:hypothetical protein
MLRFVLEILHQKIPPPQLYIAPYKPIGKRHVGRYVEIFRKKKTRPGSHGAPPSPRAFAALTTPLCSITNTCCPNCSNGYSSGAEISSNVSRCQEMLPVVIVISKNGAMDIVIPQLEAERLLLRESRQDDFEIMATFSADPVSKYCGGPCNREEAWRKFAAFPGHWALRGYGPWAIEVKGTDTFVGTKSLSDTDKGPFPTCR